MPASSAQPQAMPSSPRLSPLLERRIESSALTDIYESVLSEKRLSFEQGVRLYETSDLLAVGALANLVRERKNGNYAFFNRNLHINYTNVCTKACRFCAFHRLPGREGGYTLQPSDVEARLSQWANVSITEVHMVGGVNPELPFSYYTDLLATVKRLRPGLHIKAFTMVELAQMIRLSGLGERQTILALKEAGLNSCPGGGCEVLSNRLHRKLFPAKLRPEQWLELQRLVHQCGLRTNATMLYGHVETPAERVEHFMRLREVQDETGGFQAFIPLAFHPDNTKLSDLPRTTGFDDLKTLAVARLMLDNFPHIKAFWIMVSPKLAQVSLGFGADDLDGTVLDERITHEAGASTPKGLTLGQLLDLVRETGRVPAERDTLYNILQVH